MLPFTMRRTLAKRAMGSDGRIPQLLAWSIVLNVILLLYIAFSGQGGGIADGPLTQLVINWNGGHPLDEQNGTCYCNAAKYCLCTPNLAIDLVIMSGSNHVWLVRRKDTGQLATMGGFVQVGETVETAVKRELMEEMGIVLTEPPVLFGVYSDPRRDNRRHTVSVTYAIRAYENIHPVAADDVKEVHRIALDDIESHSFFADHKTILMDFRNYLRRETLQSREEVGDFANDIVRSICLVDNKGMLSG